jgi:hypothetical protein
MKLKIYPVGEKDEERYWVLKLTDEGATIEDHTGEVRGNFSLRTVREMIMMPSFWKSRHHLEIQTKMGLQSFDLTARQKRDLQFWLDQAYVRLYPDAPTRVVWVSLGMMLGGFTIALVGAIVSYISYEAAAQNPEGGNYVVLTGVLGMGAILALQGLVKLFEYPHWRRVSESVRRYRRPR